MLPLCSIPLWRFLRLYCMKGQRRMRSHSALVQVVVLEARDRLGGRVHTHTLSGTDGQTAKVQPYCVWQLQPTAVQGMRCDTVCMKPALCVVVHSNMLCRSFKRSRCVLLAAQGSCELISIRSFWLPF